MYRLCIYGQVQMWVLKKNEKKKYMKLHIKFSPDFNGIIMSEQSEMSNNWGDRC